ncbi:MAG TPA: flagellar biosynthetic protein FliR [Acidobacteriaceae bacterium]|jgi:flagellar biosynthetic protein FliR
MIEVPLEKVILAFLAISVRITGLMLFAPLFGSVSVPPQLKAAFVIVFSILLYPVLSPGLALLRLNRWPEMVFGELLIGAVLGIVTNLVFDAAQMAGQVLSMQMGLSQASLFDPMTQADSTVLAVFHQTIAMLIFLSLDVHLWLLHAIGESFFALPPGSMHISEVFTLGILRMGGQVFVLGLQMAAPIFCATLLADVVLGLLGRASPHMPLMMLGPALKTLLGLGVLFAALKYWPSLLDGFFLESLRASDRMLELAR